MISWSLFLTGLHDITLHMISSAYFLCEYTTLIWMMKQSPIHGVTPADTLRERSKLLEWINLPNVADLWKDTSPFETIFSKYSTVKVIIKQPPTCSHSSQFTDSGWRCHWRKEENAKQTALNQLPGGRHAESWGLRPAAWAMALQNALEAVWLGLLLSSPWKGEMAPLLSGLGKAYTIVLKFGTNLKNHHNRKATFINTPCT